MCKNQTSLTLQRPYRDHLRRDIKDRRISGAVLARHEARTVFQVDSLTLVACLPHSCTLLGNHGFSYRQSSSNIWSCPSLSASCSRCQTLGPGLQSLCWYGDTWRKHTRIFMESTDSRHLHRFEKNIASQQKVAIVPSCVRSMFRVAHPPSVPRKPHCLSTLWLSCCPPVQERTALLQSDTGIWFGRCGVASSLFPQSWAALTKVAIFILL